MKRHRFIENGLNCEVYIPKQNNKNRSAIFLYGFPGSVGANITTDLLIKNGYTVFMPNYYGTYDSNGTHTPISALQTLTDLSNAISKGEFKDIKSQNHITIPINVELVAASSFGCFIALRSLNVFQDVNSLLLIAPAITFCNSGANFCGLLEDGIENIEYVIRSRPYTYRIGDRNDWLKLFSGQYDIPVSNTFHSLKNIIGIVGDNDSTFDLQRLNAKFKSLIQKIINSDAQIQLETVSGGSHSAESLLTIQTIEKIKFLF